MTRLEIELKKMADASRNVAPTASKVLNDAATIVGEAVRIERENADLRAALQASTGNLILWEKSDPIGTAHFLPERIAANESLLSNTPSDLSRHE